MIIDPKYFEGMSYVEYYAEQEFWIHFSEFEANRMYPIRDTRRMSRADFIKHTLFNRLNRKPRKES